MQIIVKRTDTSAKNKCTNVNKLCWLCMIKQYKHVTSDISHTTAIQIYYMNNLLGHYTSNLVYSFHAWQTY